MRFSAAIVLCAAALVSATNTVEFVNQDDKTRIITFTPSSGSDDISSLTIAGYATSNVTFPTSWVGNWWAKEETSDATSGILGEVSWDAWDGITYFDISAIVNPDDTNDVKMLYPKESESPVSGCQTYPCANAYNSADDVETVSTTETTLVCLIGDKGTQAKERRHPRHFVTGHHHS